MRWMLGFRGPPCTGWAPVLRGVHGKCVSVVEGL